MPSPTERSAHPHTGSPDKIPYNPQALSYSKLSRYDTCPMQYRYRYRDGFRLKFQRADGAFLFPAYCLLSFLMFYSTHL